MRSRPDRFARLLVLCLMTAAPRAPAAQLRLSTLVGDGMVMQRDARVTIWGWADPGDEVTVTFNRRTYAARADAAGHWTVTLPPLAAGGPYDMTVARKAERVEVRDILVGDVWVCSGQSNMEWVVADSKDATQEIAGTHDPRIRHFKVPRGWAETPTDTLAAGGWQVADAEHVGRFTAVGYFFARELRKTVDVPIGLINTSWGGSRIEPWMSARALRLDEQGVQAVIRQERAYEQQVLDSLLARIGGSALPGRDDGLVDGRALWADPALDDAGWAEIEVPKPWEQAGYDGMDGVAWYRTTFTLTEAAARAGIRLGLGTIDDSDVSWVNGHEVGRMALAWNQPRVYEVPASVLVPGRNVIAIRVEDTGGGGGLYGDPNLLYVESDGEKRALAGSWKFKVGAVTINFEGRKNQVATLLYNRMVHPMLRYPIKGALWYQGESNASPGDALKYRTLFADMIRDWRRGWDVGQFPFLFVQLANYMAPDSQPSESDWALLRESQTTALGLRNTAQAVAIDIGEASDIHPRNKQEVGRRLALAARKVAYGEAVEYSGPLYRRHRVRGGRVVVEFDHVGGGLVTKDQTAGVKGFAIAGSDWRFVWADAAIEGNHVVVWSDRVSNPVAVRYAWADNPQDANLYNKEGLPAAPFRTDTWLGGGTVSSSAGH
jgi:sialate O-acetylesterase